MEQEELRQLFCAKITLELNRYKQKILEQSVCNIFESAFQIDSMINIYEVLLEMSQETEEKTLKILLVYPSLLAFLYEQWLQTDDSYIEELKECLEKEITRMEQRYQVVDKGDKVA